MLRKKPTFLDVTLMCKEFRRYLVSLSWIAGIATAALYGLHFAIRENLICDSNAMILARFSQYMAAMTLAFLAVSLTIRPISEYIAHKTEFW